MLSNPVVCMLKNTKTGRFHPILYAENPLPGPDSEDKPVRHKSHGHHTIGFDTREEAVASIEQEIRPKANMVRCFLDDDIEWNGEGIPADVRFFPKA